MYRIRESRSRLCRQLVPQFDRPIYKGTFYRYLFFVSWPKYYDRDHPCPGSMVLVTCLVELCMCVLRYRLWRGRECEPSSYAALDLITPNRSYGLQIWSLSFAHGLTHLSDLPCMDPSTKPHILESDALLTFRLIFLFTLSLFENAHYEMQCLPDSLYRVIYLISPA